MTSRTTILGDFAAINPKHEKGTPPETPVSFVGMSNIDAESASVTSEEIRMFGETTKGFTQFKKGDVLLAKITPCFENGKIAQATISEPLGSGSTEFHVIRAHEGSADPRFLLHMLRHPKILFDGERKMTGSSGHRRVPESYVVSITLPNYSVGTQKRAGEALDTLESLREKRRRSIELLDELTQSIFLDMFAEMAMDESKTENLGTHIEFLTSGSRGWAKYYSNKPGDVFLRIQNVRMNELDLTDVAYVNAPDTAEAKRTLTQPGDVLLSITADLGRTAVVPSYLERAFINQHLSILRTSKMNPTYLSAYLSSEYGQRQILKKNRAGVKAGLNFNDIRSLEIPVPPRKLQEEFASRLESVRQIKTKHLTHLAHLDELFASVQQRAFDGTLWDDPVMTS